MAAPYFTPKIANIVVTTAGTRVNVKTTAIPFRSITIQANSTNAGAIYVGDNTVSSVVYGVRLGAGATLQIANDNNDAKMLLSDLWIDAGTNGDGISILYY